MSGGQRIDAGAARGERITFTVDDDTVEAFEGETIAAALLAAGRRSLRRTWLTGAPRGLFCCMGICFECVVEVDGEMNVPSCVTLVKPGMRVSTLP
jgi:predicted molibdopterin-dependent oxidoreductase YjgC